MTNTSSYSTQHKEVKVYNSIQMLKSNIPREYFYLRDEALRVFILNIGVLEFESRKLESKLSLVAKRSFRLYQREAPQHIKIKGNRIYFPKFKEGIYFKGSKDRLTEIEEINQIVITKDAGDYYCSIIYEIDNELRDKKSLSAENLVGRDLGVEKFVTLSNGIAIENPRFITKMEKA